MFKPQVRKLFLYFVFFVFFGGAPSVLAASNVLLLVCFLYALGCALIDRRKFDKEALYPIILFAVINCTSVIYWGSQLELQAYIGYNLRLLLAYFLLKFVCGNFIIFYQKAIYLAAIISIPFYLIQLVDVDFFYRYFSFMNLANPENIVRRHNWNCLIYTSFPRLSSFVRNSGFTAEPSVFGFYLGLGIIIELFSNHFRFNKRALIELSVGLTTFSTTFYMVLIFIFCLIALKRNIKYKLIYLLGAIIGIGIFFTSEFGEKKILELIDNTKRLEERGYDIYENKFHLSRMSNVKVACMNFLNFPIGHGMNQAGLIRNSSGLIVAGSGSLSNNTIIWGISFLIFFPWIIYRFWRALNRSLAFTESLILILIFSMWMFSSISIRDQLWFVVLYIGILGYVPIYKRYRDCQLINKRN